MTTKAICRVPVSMTALRGTRRASATGLVLILAVAYMPGLSSCLGLSSVIRTVTVRLTVVNVRVDKGNRPGVRFARNCLDGRFHRLSQCNQRDIVFVHLRIEPQCRMVLDAHHLHSGLDRRTLNDHLVDYVAIRRAAERDALPAPSAAPGNHVNVFVRDIP